MPENIEELKTALDLVINSEEVGIECENANYHSLTDFLQEIRNGLHEHDFSGPPAVDNEWETEWVCAYDGCGRYHYVQKP